MLAVLLAFTGCGTTTLQLPDGRAVESPRPAPSSSEQVRRYCEALHFAPYDGPVSGALMQQRRSCAGGWKVRGERATCADKLPPPARNDARNHARQLDSCVADMRRQFDRDVVAYEQFNRLRFGTTERDFEGFIRKYQGNDPLGLLPEARRKLAASCAGKVPDSSRTDPAGYAVWIARFELVQPEHCAQELAQARQVRHGQLLAMQMSRINRATDKRSLDAGLEEFRSVMVPEAVQAAEARRQEFRDRDHAAALAAITTWPQADAFISQAGTDIAPSTLSRATTLRSSLREKALAQGSFDDLLPLVRAGDREARARAEARAGGPSQLRTLESIAAGTTVDDLRRALSESRLYWASKLLTHLGDAADSGLRQRFRQQVLAKGNFELVFPLAQGNDFDALKRAYDLAAPGDEQRQVDERILKDLASKAINYKVELRGDGKHRASDTDVWISRRLELAIQSPLTYEVWLDTSILKPRGDVRLVVRLNALLSVKGEVKGERNCGLLWMSKCEVDQKRTDTYPREITATLSAATGWRATGSSLIDWKAVSGGSGVASGLIMGGSLVFKAVDLDLTAGLASTTLAAVP